MTRSLLGRWWPVVDIGVLAAIAVVQIILYFWVSRDLQLALALDHRTPDLWAWWAYAFVHDHAVPGAAHLWNNL